MSQAIENRLTELEDKVLYLEVGLAMANHREQALIEVLGWLLAMRPERDGSTYLIDRLDALETQPTNPERLEVTAVHNDLLALVGIWYDDLATRKEPPLDNAVEEDE